MYKIYKILINATPVILMIGLIPLIENDYVLSLFYVVIIVSAFLIKKEKGDVTAFIAGLVIMVISEYFFIKTGVETFNRTSLFNVMPIWLSILWAYGFVAIKRVLNILSA